MDTISREGDIIIGFNQKMKVPPGITIDVGPGSEQGRRLYIQNYLTDPVTKKRRLIGLSELDVTRDIVDFTFVTTADQESTKIEFYLDMSGWTSTKLGIGINFTEPLNVGRGNEQVLTTMKNPIMFQPDGPGEPLRAEDSSVTKGVPAQVPKDVSESKLIADA